eukprot:36540-Eustigmatos_ZCMA.PRE.1
MPFRSVSIFETDTHKRGSWGVVRDVDRPRVGRGMEGGMPVMAVPESGAVQWWGSVGVHGLMGTW